MTKPLPGPSHSDLLCKLGVKRREARGSGGVRSDGFAGMMMALDEGQSGTDLELKTKRSRPNKATRERRRRQRDNGDVKGSVNTLQEEVYRGIRSSEGGCSRWMGGKRFNTTEANFEVPEFPKVAVSPNRPSLQSLHDQLDTFTSHLDILSKEITRLKSTINEATQAVSMIHRKRQLPMKTVPVYRETPHDRYTHHYELNPEAVQPKLPLHDRRRGWLPPKELRGRLESEELERILLSEEKARKGLRRMDRLRGHSSENKTRGGVLKDKLYERYGLHSQKPYDQCETLA